MKHDVYLYQDILPDNYKYVTSYLNHLFPVNTLMDIEVKVYGKQNLNSIRTDKKLNGIR